MPTIRVGLTVASVQLARPNYAYGSSLKLDPLKISDSGALMRGAIPTSIPKTAVVTSAVVWVSQEPFVTWAGSNTLNLYRNLSSYKESTVTRANSPALAGLSGSQTKTGSAPGTWWTIPVTADVQAFIAGTKSNFGWRMTTSSSTVRKIRSQAADTRQPFIEITYTLTPRVPTNLSPAGASVSLASPVLTFSVGDGSTAIQVQVDPASDATTPDFDSGTVAATAGVLDLADTAYAGLDDGDTTFWRARSQGAGGWSDWSPWVDFTRADLESLSLDAPTTTPADGSPPFEWTFGGTQTAWEASLLDTGGKVLSTSGVIASADVAWTPPTGLTKNGDQGTARIRVWDDVVRIATPGAPAYAEATVDFTVTLTGSVTPMTTLTASQSPSSPGVALAGTRSTGGIPDEVIVFRDGVQVDRFPGTDIFTSSTAFAYTDWSATMDSEVTYRLAPAVNGEVASGGPSVDVTPHCDGLWLVDPATDTAVVLWGVDGGSWDATDLATVHTPIAVGATVVRRRLRRGVISGSASGEIIDGKGYEAADMLAALDTFASNDAGTVYRLVAGHLNLPVIAGDFLVAPLPTNAPGQTWAKAQFNFWGQ